MKMHFIGILLLFPILFYAQVERVGVNTVNPTRLLDVFGSGTNDDHILLARVNWSGPDDVRALEGYSVPMLGYGYGTYTTGGFKGLHALNPAGSYNGTTYAIFGSSTGTAGTRIGVYGRAAGGARNLAAKFEAGDVEIDNDVRIGTTANNTGRLLVNNSNKVFGSNATALRVQSTNNGSENTYGILVSGSNSGTGSTYGIFSTVNNNSSTRSAYGVYTSATDSKDWGLYSIGRNYINGDLRINTQEDPYNGAYALIINGRMISEEVLIQNSNSWPDYVFDESYSLMPLEELEKSIQENHHLPNIPPAKELEENGVPVGEIQIKMMEKIEELTLYVIQQQKEINALKKKLDQINK